MVPYCVRGGIWLSGMHWVHSGGGIGLIVWVLVPQFVLNVCRSFALVLCVVLGLHEAVPLLG